MRLHFISRLALLMAGSFLVVATQEQQVWGVPTLQWFFAAGGGIALVIVAADAVQSGAVQRGIDFLTALVAAWGIVEVFALHSADVKWWSFGTAAAIAGLSVLGLIVNETNVERVVHELRVSHDDSGRRVHAAA